MIHETIDIKINANEYDSCGQSPKLYSYVLEKGEFMPSSFFRPAVVICPGGGYSFVSEREAEPIAAKYLSMGFSCFILNYSVAPARFPTALLEAAYLVSYIRQHAKEYGIDENKIGIVGFSAGGHLAASLSVFWNEDFIAKALNVKNELVKPNGTVLSYPVITSGKFAHTGSFECLLGEKVADSKLMEKLSLENSVNEHTPPTFIWHTYEDGLVPVQNSLLYANALSNYEIPFEMHIYQRGGHGLSLANEITNDVMPDCQNWIDMSARWLKNI